MVGNNDPDWEPTEYVDDPQANAILNVAAAIFDLSKSVNELLYGLKFGKQEGMSIAEAIEVGSKNIESSLDAVASAIQEKE